jgi:two-component system CheB/CheR fusion protein
MGKKQVKDAQGLSVKPLSSSKKSDILDFPVVGIGASAGGLEALQDFFQKMPLNPGAAFIVIQHLSPDYKSLMDELLARYTKLKIMKVEDGMQVEINCIYLIPPKMNMTIFHGKLMLIEQSSERTLNLPIDIFFRSLAKDQERNAIGIILSGTGSDGTLGIRAIKEGGGIIMVQDDKSAKFDGMPKSSINTGIVDFILPPTKLAEALVSYIKHPFISKSEQIEEQISQDENQLSKVISILRESSGVDFSNYKENTIIRRLEKRISINRFELINDYVKFLHNNKRESHILFNEMLIGVTKFFRDEMAFEALSEKVLENILLNKKKSSIRIWVTACSTGEEAYTTAILLKEIMGQHKIHKDVKIFATDIDENSLEFAGTGHYPESIASDVSPLLLSKYFSRKQDGYFVNESIRSMIIFAKHNILSDPPFSKLDLITCRNLLIYLKTDVQQRILSMFYHALAEDSFLFLGSSESLGNLTDGFTVVDTKAKIYKYKHGFRTSFLDNYAYTSVTNGSKGLKNLSSYIQTTKPKSSNLSSVFDDLLSDFIPPSVLIDENYDVVHTIHDVSKFLSIPIGQMSLNLLKMLPKDMSLIISGLLRKAEKKSDVVIFDNIQTKSLRDNSVKISGRKVTDKKTNEIYFLISFQEKSPEVLNTVSVQKIDINIQYQERIDELERDLQFKSESLQATVEELETSNEELQSSNEELIASNEELQSTNEELQSVNEELYTVNSEHIRKIEELTELNADVDNLLKNTNIGTLFLDEKLCIRKVNQVASKLTNIMDSDIGRPIKHFSFKNLIGNFYEILDEVYTTLRGKDIEVADFYGKQFLMKVMPYRTAENAVSGLVVIFVDIANLKKSQSDLQVASNELSLAIETGKIFWWEYDVETGHFATKGQYAENILGDFAKGDHFYEEWLKNIQKEDLLRVKQNMSKFMSSSSSVFDVEYRILNRMKEYIWVHDRARAVEVRSDGKPLKLVGIILDIHENKIQMLETERVLKALEVSNRKFDLLFNSFTIGIVYQNQFGQIIDANPKAVEILGVCVEDMRNLTSESADWAAIKEDGSIFSGEEHPAMLALNTGHSVENVVMGIINPKKGQRVWIKISAIPLFNRSQKTPFQVYTYFEEINM